MKKLHKSFSFFFFFFKKKQILRRKEVRNQPRKSRILSNRDSRKRSEKLEGRKPKLLISEKIKDMNIPRAGTMDEIRPTSRSYQYRIPELWGRKA